VRGRWSSDFGSPLSFTDETEINIRTNKTGNERKRKFSILCFGFIRIKIWKSISIRFFLRPSIALAKGRFMRRDWPFYTGKRRRTRILRRYLMYTQPFPGFGATHMKRNFCFLASGSDWTSVFMHSGWNVAPSSIDNRWSDPERSGDAGSQSSVSSFWHSRTAVTKNEWKSSFSLSIVTVNGNCYRWWDIGRSRRCVIKSKFGVRSLRKIWFKNSVPKF